MHHKGEWRPRHSPWVTACHENLIIPSNAHGGKLAGSLRRDFPRRLIESRVNNHSTYLMTWMMSVSHARSRNDSLETQRTRFPYSFLFFRRASVILFLVCEFRISATLSALQHSFTPQSIPFELSR